MSRHVKSRSGCRVCKAKRLKCDETVPACRNCVNRGIACPGYRQVLRWSTKYETGFGSTPKTKPKRGAAVAAAAATATPSTTTAESFSKTSTTSSTSAHSPPPPDIPEFAQLATAVSRSIGSPPEPASLPLPLPPPQRSPAQPQPQPQPPPSWTQPSLPSRPDRVAFSPSLSLHSPAASSSSTSSSSSSSGRSAAAASTSSSTVLLPYASGLARPDTAPAGWPPDWTADPFAPRMPSQSPTVSLSSTSGTVAAAVEQAASEQAFDEEAYGLETVISNSVTTTNTNTILPYAPPASHPRELALPGLSLVELWFQSVCGMWAAFDSAANPFRSVCASLWSSSEAVFFSMQTMAAASLPRRPASVREIVLVAPQRSTQALIRELQQLFREVPARGRGGKRSIEGASSPPPIPLPAGLLAALFCMSSSLSWIDARQLGIQYLRNARSVIELLDLHRARLAPGDRDLLEFFRGCLLYEEMLRSVVTDDQEDIQALLAWEEDDAGDTHEGTPALSLHAWVGVPVVLIALFGQVMALCRRSRRHWSRTARATYHLLYQAMRDIEHGRRLEARLLAIDLRELMRGEEPEAGDNQELRAHLYKAAEVYRLSALLQLYQTFPDLVVGAPAAGGADTPQESAPPDVPDAPDPPGTNPAATSRRLLPLVLHIVDLLAEIPASSPMRCLMPLLCLCAGSGLRMPGRATVSGTTISTTTTETTTIEPCPASLPGDGLGDLLLYGDMHSVWTAGLAAAAGGFTPVLPSATATTTSTAATTTTTHAVRVARNALRLRLARLEQNLPPRPIVVARQLLERVWATYDEGGQSHWLDVMAETNFESVFG